ncbi:MAG: hypothetical protein LUC21_07540 [Oscillospiraceae bacterium]|nr:hypothetical protein [Oscillospiraceae bacterium]MCC8156710.1 hypothetical protein [Oscillospiraceae bacterium]MCD8001489.1 hypothetical protein [Oscillospiraceae bacterium]MCD8128278.1 hypothetical protein [Oscillospiraceae bacterium]MCD8358589.1 hypothetical protein [Oscillospiraceae bacterium]
MEWTVRLSRQFDFAELRIQAGFVGDCALVHLEGGEAPHIGCTVLALPRPSLRGDGTVSATSSVLNVTGHKDEAICRPLAEQVCRRLNRVTVCTGGFHIDGIASAQIQTLTAAIQALADAAADALAAQDA